MQRILNFKESIILICFISLMSSWFILPDWSLNIVCLACCNGLVVLGLLVLMRAGLISFGHGLYYCLGGYTVAIAYNFLNVKDAFILLSIAIIFGGLLSYLLGFFVRKFRGIFFAMMNLALSMILFGIIVKSVSLGSTDGFGIKELTYFGYKSSEQIRLHIVSYFFIISVTFICIFLVSKYIKSPIGKMVLAIKDNEIRANYLGINVSKQIHNIYLISGVLASLGGALMVILVGHVTPEDTAYWTKSGEFVFVAILSGIIHVIAPLIGSLFFEFIRTFALYLFPNTWQMTIGIILILGIIYLPEGIGSIFNKIKNIKNAFRSKKSL
tara:strand:+ start:2443 stop:3420 length:978 start_codon:yes stop_codon:yes gene_type:complete